ncbi:hypothetical protein P3T76_007416 [Phytophthora citrophthora]|uniref:Uncharacterized protein n=1 Tax=Phytophthora citrophthora TaxID=4793 RepID=A0AAD9GN89_9STRA|nr:hypothetical protein P3T76_007416 [Phytophthora citrophthora]
MAALIQRCRHRTPGVHSEERNKRRTYQEPNIVFILPRPLIQQDIHEIKAQCGLEGLCERESDSAVCVVIPGIGLGWVQRDAVECIEREPLESTWGYQDGRYTVQLGCKCMNGADTIMDLLVLIGNQVHSLSFNFGSYVFSLVPQIIQSCPNLQHLSLQSMYLPERGVEALLDTLQTDPMRTLLLTLNLNKSNSVLDSVVQQLAALLGSKGNLALQELRLHGRVLSGTTITALKNSLLSNRELKLLQLTRAYPWLEAQQYQEQNQLSEVHDGLLLQLTLPMEAKLAFASVFSHKSSPVLEGNLLALIFQFAGRDARRVIAWTVDIDCS